MQVLSLPERVKTRAGIAGLKALTRFLPIPTPMVLLGPDSALRLCDTIAHRGIDNILIVTDSVLNGLGVIDPIKAALEKHGVKVHVYDGVKPDPTVNVVKQGLNQLKQAGSKAILAVGGGSAIDAGKVISMAAVNGGNPAKMVGFFKARKGVLPFFAIPTTAGTGSEATIGAVISDDETHQKGLVVDPKIVPIATALDPVIMQGMPKSVTAETAIDALTHSLESWVSELASKESDDYAAASIRMIFESLPTAYEDGRNLEARSALALASHYGGLALNKASLGYVHAIAHQLGAYYGIPHGRANAIVLPHILEVSRDAASKRLADLARRIGIADNSLSDQQASGLMIDRVRELIAQVNINTHVPKMNEKDFQKMAKAAFKEAHGKYPVPQYLTNEQVLTILKDIAATPERQPVH